VSPGRGGRLLGVLSAALVLGACAGGETPAERGRQVYQAYCTSCHAADPARDGPIGPAIKGASRELLETRVVRGTYPPGYTPKRQSSIMQPMPNLAPEIPNLAAFLR
jgi:mono/diheme cytochrome c family protein